MKLWSEGDFSRGLCERCKTLVSTRFERRTVPLEGPRVIEVPNVLIEVCVDCGEPISIPPQSTPRLREARRESDRVEVRVPGVLDDAMELVADKYAVRLDALESPLVLHYLRRIGEDGRVAARVKTLLGSRLATGRADARVRIRVPRDVLDIALAAAKAAGVNSQSDLIRGILVAAAHDAGIAVETSIKPDRRSRSAIATIAGALA